MSRYIEDAIIVNNRKLNDKYFVLDLRITGKIDEIKAGQFLQMQVPNGAVLLRRPFSIHDIDKKNSILKVLIQIVGKGTKELSKTKAGETINILYPLGNGFVFDKINGRSLLIGGGCGVAPLLLLARQMNELQKPMDILIGVRSKSDLIEVDEYAQLANLFITTEDGSEGTKGFVTHHEVMQRLSDYEQIFTCGPEVMMKAIAKRAKEANVPCQVSLENTMACGIGACLCCITPSEKGNVCVCTEGPVFNSNFLLW